MRGVVVVLAVFLAALPIAPNVSLATDPAFAARVQEAEQQQGPAREIARRTEAAADGAQKDEVKAPGGYASSDEPAEEEGMSPLSRIGIGVGVVAVVGVGLAFAGGGSSDSGPTMPTPESLVGKWNAQARCTTDSRTYNGMYDLQATGSHTYDIYVTGDNVRKQGNGHWSLIEGTSTLRLENDTGSIYLGEFHNENFTTVTLNNQGNKWELVLTRQ